MNQNSTYLKSVYQFIRFFWGLSILITLILFLRMVTHPHELRPPVNFSVSKAGEVIQNQTFSFSIKRAHGHVSYPEGYQPSSLDMLVYHGSKVIELLLGLFILYQIKTMLKQTLTGNTFNTINSQRLRWIGWTILILGLLKYVESIYSNYHFDGTLFLEPISTWSDKSVAYQSGYVLGWSLGFLSSPFLLAGMSALVLSLVFKEETTLKEEAALTI